MLEVDAHALFTAVVLNEVTAAAIDEIRTAPRRIAVRRELDLDHFGAHLGKHQGTGRARHDMREIEHFVAVKHMARNLTSHQSFLLQSAAYLSDVSLTSASNSFFVGLAKALSDSAC